MTLQIGCAKKVSTDMQHNFDDAVLACLHKVCTQHQTISVAGDFMLHVTLA